MGAGRRCRVVRLGSVCGKRLKRVRGRTRVSQDVTRRCKVRKCEVKLGKRRGKGVECGVGRTGGEVWDEGPSNTKQQRKIAF